MDGTIQTFRLTSSQQRYLEQQLEGVSRSFALVIPYIETPLRHYLAAAYLLCRVADNIEDCGQPHAWKTQRFDEFLNLLLEPHNAARQLAAWEQRAWPGLTEDERQMMGASRGLALWQIYAMIPPEAQAVIQRWISVMARGMNQVAEPDERPLFVRRKNVSVLETESDYNDYCYYVAGTVGALASELVIQQYGLAADVSSTLQARADSCGRSLQKTNIVKDFVADLNRGVCYLPDTWVGAADYAPLELRGADLQWKAHVIGNVLDELRQAVDYVLALPQHAAGYRRASLMCLFPAYYTMLSAAQSHAKLFTSAHQIKISRTTIAQCISDSNKMLHNDQAIQHYCSRLENRIFNEIGQPLATPKL